LTEAFELIMDMRRGHHVAQVRAGLPPDDLLDPEALSPLARAQLIEALKLVAAEQKRLGRFVPIGI
jgi:signal-transduction protein with cAMP-binding, CBS, and nucleotidyltransferase domain